MRIYPLAASLLLICVPAASSQLAVQAEMLYTMTGDLKPLHDGVVLCSKDGRIERVGPRAEVGIPGGYRLLKAKVATPGFIDAHTTVGLSGILNLDRHDQEQLETSAPIQPELRAIDAYNGRDPLVQWIRELGVTTIHTGHAPGALVAGQTMILKTNIRAITDPGQNTLRPFAMVASTLGSAGFGKGGKSPGTRAKSLAMLREHLLKAQRHLKKRNEVEEGEKPDPNLRLDAMAAVLEGKAPLLVTAKRHQDIAAALRLQREFNFPLILDGASEAYLLLDEIKEARVPVIIHPTMARPYGENENITFTLAAKLYAAGIPFAFQSGYEAYVPKTRVVHFEAALSVAYGLPHEVALAGCTSAAAEILGLEKRIGSLQPGLEADLALFDGDPLETVTHCTGVIIDGKIVSRKTK